MNFAHDPPHPDSWPSHSAPASRALIAPSDGDARIHEIGHVLVNLHDAARNWYPNLDRRCTTQEWPSWFDSQLEPLPEAYDDLMEFHYESDSDSEYITIRKRVEPIPQY